MKLSLVVGCAALSLMVGPALGRVIPPGENVAGISQATLADAFYQWIVLLPKSANPLFDATGVFANDQPRSTDAPSNPAAGNVFLLAGTSSAGFATRSFNVPAGVPLFLPLSTTTDFELPRDLDPSSCLGKPDPYGCATGFLGPQPPPNPFSGAPVAMLDGVALTVDGVSIADAIAADSTAFFQRSDALAPYCLASTDNVLAFALYPDGACGEFVQQGYYLALSPLSPGKHTLEFGFGPADTGFGAIDTINVAPEPSTWALLLMGFAGLGLAGYRASRQDARLA